jgi:hypothetical protein
MNKNLEQLLSNLTGKRQRGLRRQQMCRGGGGGHDNLLGGGEEVADAGEVAASGDSDNEADVAARAEP